MGVLKARVSGAWVEVGGGGSEVEVSASDPIAANPSAELWVDTSGVGVLKARVGGAWVNVGTSSGGGPTVISYAEVTVNTTNIGPGGTTISGLTATFTAISGHRYRITISGHMTTGGAAGDSLRIAVKNGGSDLLVTYQIAPGAGVTSAPIHMAMYKTSLTGTVNLTVFCSKQSGTGPFVFVGSSSFPAYLMVEDLG